MTRQARSQAKAVKPVLQHEFGNLALFSPQTCQMNEIGWAIAFPTRPHVC